MAGAEAPWTQVCDASVRPGGHVVAARGRASRPGQGADRLRPLQLHRGRRRHGQRAGGGQPGRAAPSGQPRQADDLVLDIRGTARPAHHDRAAGPDLATCRLDGTVQARPGARHAADGGGSILGLVTKSANDAAAALGELLGGSEDRFAQMMTLRARALGMSHTTFTNASGLPDPDEWTTARDMAILARHLLTDFPGFYPYFSTHSFTFHRRVIFNHDRMLQSYPGADGMKTGYTEASGHNLVTSAVHSGVRLIGVVLGAASNPERDAHMAMLLDQGFDQMDVPAERRTTLASRLPGLVSTAHAATLAVPGRRRRATRAGPGPFRSAVSATRRRRARRRDCSPRGRRWRGPHRDRQPAWPDHLARPGRRPDLRRGTECLRRAGAARYQRV